jgi:hypothetical protein
MKYFKLYEEFVSESSKATFIKFKGKKVSMSSIEIEGVDSKDYPDFVDAFAAAAEWTNGKELTDSELDDFNDEFPEYIQELAMESFH